jgi:hypothetical protein
MDILEVLPTDEINLGKFYELARQVYANDSVWVPQSESAFQSLLASREHQFVQPLLCVQDEVPLARAVAILNPSALDTDIHPVGYIGFFECLEQHPLAGSAVLESAHFTKARRNNNSDSPRG